MRTPTQNMVAGMGTKRLNAKIFSYLWTLLKCVVWTHDTEVVSNVYTTHTFLLKSENQMKKKIKIKIKIKRPMKFTRTSKKLKIMSVKNSHQVSKGACYRFRSMAYNIGKNNFPKRF
jgi:hypothetical protein